MPQRPEVPARQRTEDPVLRTARREALFVLSMWLVVTIYSVGYCTTFGYNRKIEDLTFVLGFPDWVFWGIVLPWALCVVVGIGFAYFFMTDHDIGTGSDDQGADL